MPKFSKKRARAEEDDNESGSDAPVASGPSKKSKSAAALDSGKDSDGNLYWDLSAKRRVGISEFKNNTLINIREYYELDGEMKPGKKGISLSIEQYQALLNALPAINAELRKKGHDLKVADGAMEGVEAPAAAALVKKRKTSKKANIEATSDEDSSD